MTVLKFYKGLVTICWVIFYVIVIIYEIYINSTELVHDYLKEIKNYDIIDIINNSDHAYILGKLLLGYYFTIFFPPLILFIILKTIISITDEFFEK